MPNFSIEDDPLLKSVTSTPEISSDAPPVQILVSASSKDITPKQLQSKAWRMSNLYYITDKHANFVLFKPNTAQLHFLKNKSFYNIILKSRQLGFTTLATIDMLDNVLFRTNFHSLLISYDDESAKDLFQKKVQFAWEHLHPDLRSKYIIDASRSNLLRLDHGEGNYSSFKVDNTGRSATYNQVHISEFASICKNYPEKVDKIIRGTFPAVHPPYGQITIESTSEGPSGEFYEMYQEASKLPPNHVYKPKEFKAFFYNWQWDIKAIADMVKEPDPNIPKEFRDIQAKHNELHKHNPQNYKYLTDIELTYWYYLWNGDCKKSWKKLFLEYPLTPEDAFKKNSKNIFDADNLQDLIAKAKLITPKEFRGWLFYDEIKANHQYVLAGDPSEGAGNGDDAAAVLIDFTPRIPKIVATFTDKNTPPDIFAYELRVIGELANFALIMVERNNHGHTTLATLKGIYPSDYIYKEVIKSKIDDEQTEKLGWHTNGASKPKMGYEFASALNDNLIEIPSLAILQEALNFDRSELNTIKIKDNNSETTKHFDLLMASMIAYQGRTELEVLSTSIQVNTTNTQEDLNAPF